MQRLLVTGLVATTYALFQFYLKNGYLDVTIIARLGVWDIGFLHNTLSWALALAPLLWMPLVSRRPSDALSWLLLLFVHMPVQVLAPHVIDPSADDIIPFQVLCALSFYALTLVGRLRVVRIRRPGVSMGLVVAIVVLLAVAIVTWSLLVYGFEPANFFSVYERREWAQSVQATGAWLLVYFFFWAGNVFVVFLVAYGHYVGRLVIVALGLALSFCLYAAVPHKGLLLNFAAAYLIMLSIVHWRDVAEVSFLRMIGVIVAAFAACFVFDLLTMGDSADYVMTRVIAGRNTMATGVSTGIYFHFFSVNPPDYYSDGVIGWLLNVLFGLKSDYGLPTAKIIGVNFASGAGSNENVHYLADAFANLGYAGLIVVGMFIAPALFYFFNCISDGRPPLLTLPLFLIQGLVIANTALQSAFLSTGLLVVLVVVWCLPTEEVEESELTDQTEAADLDWPIGDLPSIRR